VATGSTKQTDHGIPAAECTVPLPSLDAVVGIRPSATGYALGNLLGRGGEGEVHEACQLSFGRMVAIKTLRTGNDDLRQVQRFQAEAAITALLEHPNIIPVHDLRDDVAGRPQLVMKRVTGRNWRTLLMTTPMTVDEHVGILLKVCDAMEFAHSQGVLHRDLKPENIMVGEHGEVLVMDWGCAVHVGPERPHPDVRLLHELHGASGTPAYLSPEQASGDHAACGPWSDVYLLGGMLYHVLAGHPPRHGEDVRGLIADAVCGNPIPEPTPRDGKRLSSELTAVAMAALHPDPAKRTRSVTGFAVGLRLYLEHRAVLDLVNEARREQQVALAGGPAAEDAYRRALCAVEQAVRLWPELVAARRLQLALGLDTARYALGVGSLRAAVHQAQVTAAAAERFGDTQTAQQAGRLAAQAKAREVAVANRERSLHRLRRTAVIAAAAAGVILLSGVVLLWRASSRTAEALAEAQSNLELAASERRERIDSEHQAAPALLAQARELAGQRRFADGLPLTDLAAVFAPADPQPLLLKAELLIAMGQRSAAVAILDAALALGADADARELRRLCADPPADVEARLAKVLVHMGAGAAAAALNLAAGQRVELAIAQLRRQWPTLATGAVRAQPDDTLAVQLQASELRIDSLEPLRGLPVSWLDVTGQDRLRDLTPLADLPLVTLVARMTGVRDFSVLRRLPLRSLQLGWYDGGFDLDQVRGLRLEQLDAPGTGATDLGALAGMPLRELRLWGCDRLADISAVGPMPLEIFSLEAPRTGSRALSDLSPLRGKSLSELGLSWQQAVTDLSPLQGMTPRRINLNGTAVANLAPVISPALRNVAIGMTRVSDLRPLLDLPIETLDCSPQSIKTGLDEIIALPSMRAVCRYKPADFRCFLDALRAIADADPAFPWAATAGFSEGRLVELRLPNAIRTLDPLAGLVDLRILHLSGQPDDLRPLAKLHLVELVVNPARQAQGLDGLRQMTTLQRIGSSAQTVRPAADFWRDLDAKH
jgi:hypothetical protein